MPGVFAGLIAGVATVNLLVRSKQDPFFGWSAGFASLCLNFLVTATVSLLTPATLLADATAPALFLSHSPPLLRDGPRAKAPAEPGVIVPE